MARGDSVLYVVGSGVIGLSAFPVLHFFTVLARQVFYPRYMHSPRSKRISFSINFLIFFLSVAFGRVHVIG